MLNKKNFNFEKTLILLTGITLITLVLKGISFSSKLNRFKTRLHFQNFSHSTNKMLAEIGLGLLYLSIQLYLLNELLIPKDSVNYQFLGRLFLVFSAIATAICLATLKNFGEIEKPKRLAFDFSKLVYLVPPLVPIISYSISNKSEVSSSDLMQTIFSLLILNLLFVFIGPNLLNMLFKVKTIYIFSSATLFIIFDMARLSKSQSWFEIGNFKTQFLNLCFTFILLGSLSYLKSLLQIVILTTFLFANIAQVLLLQKTEYIGDSSATFLDIELSKKNLPNIYLLIYDSYPNSETLGKYGVNNDEQLNYLKDLDFRIYEGVYSLSASTLETMSKVLNGSPDDAPNPRIPTSGDSNVTNFLDEFNYELMGITYSDYFFLGQDPKWDTSFPTQIDSEGRFFNAILAGEFRSDLFAFKGSKTTIEDKDGFVSRKRDLIQKTSSDLKPSFMYAHSPYPGHTQNSGVCLDGEFEDWQSSKLPTANMEMKKDLASFNGDFENSIVIIAGDHGPYLTKNCTDLSNWPPNEVDRLDLQDRFGTFLAIRWPRNFQNNEDIQVLQQVLPVILKQLSDSDSSMLDEQIKSIYLSATKSSWALPPGVYVKEGLIYGGLDSGKPLFLRD